MVWTLVSKCYWRTTDLKPFTIETRVVFSKNFSAWRILSEDGTVIAKGKTDMVWQAMKVAVAYANSILIQPKTKSEAIKKWCEEKGIDYKDLPMSY